MFYEKIFFNALRIRLIEKKISEVYHTDKIQSPVHLSIGQEIVSSCLAENLNKDDFVYITYRGHAFYLARGGLSLIHI